VSDIIHSIPVKLFTDLPLSLLFQISKTRFSMASQDGNASSGERAVKS
jgi:hypothetical protein